MSDSLSSNINLSLINLYLTVPVHLITKFTPVNVPVMFYSPFILSPSKYVFVMCSYF